VSTIKLPTYQQADYPHIVMSPVQPQPDYWLSSFSYLLLCLYR